MSAALAGGGLRAAGRGPRAHHEGQALTLHRVRGFRLVPFLRGSFLEMSSRITRFKWVAPCFVVYSELCHCSSQACPH